MGIRYRYILPSASSCAFGLIREEVSKRGAVRTVVQAIASETWGSGFVVFFFLFPFCCRRRVDVFRYVLQYQALSLSRGALSRVNGGSAEQKVRRYICIIKAAKLQMTWEWYSAGQYLKC